MTLKCHCMEQRAKVQYSRHHFVFSDKSCYHYACHHIAGCYNISLLMNCILFWFSFFFFFFNVYSIK